MTSLLQRGWVGISALLLAAQITCRDEPADARRSDTSWSTRRLAMVRDQIAARGVRDQRVLRVMRLVPRHLFVPPGYRNQAYDDHPLPIGQQQTISQPYIVARMTEALRPGPRQRVLEIGTGSGYQAAVLARLVREVYTIEIIPELGRRARALLAKLGHKNVHVRMGDGYGGWPSKAPFDAIILTASPPKLPQPLTEQLKVGGTLVAPVGPAGDQRLIRIIKGRSGKLTTEHLLDVRFVPMTGKARSR